MSESMPTPMCSERCGPDWIDNGTMCRQRSPVPRPVGAVALEQSISRSGRTYVLHVFQFTRYSHGSAHVISGDNPIHDHVEAAVRIWRAAGVNLRPIYYFRFDSARTTELLGTNNSLDEGPGSIGDERLQTSVEMPRLAQLKPNWWDLAVFFVDFPGESEADAERHQVYINCEPPVAGLADVPAQVGRTVAHELGHIFLQRLGRWHSDFRSGLMQEPCDDVSITSGEAGEARRWVRDNL
jgi:hypothetical protein